jgi:DNA gyrase subunit A
VRSMGRATYGVRGIKLRPKDRVVSMEVLDPDGEILSVTALGYGKRTPIGDYRKQTRGGLGIINLKVTPKTGEVIGARHVIGSAGLMLITQDGMIIRINVSGVRVVGRSTQGVKLMDLDGEDRLVAVAKLAESDEESLAEDAEGGGGNGGDGDGGLEAQADELEPELLDESDFEVEDSEPEPPETVH